MRPDDADLSPLSGCRRHPERHAEQGLEKRAKMVEQEDVLKEWEVRGGRETQDLKKKEKRDGDGVGRAPFSC